MTNSSTRAARMPDSWTCRTCENSYPINIDIPMAERVANVAAALICRECTSLVVDVLQEAAIYDLIRPLAAKLAISALTGLSVEIEKATTPHPSPDVTGEAWAPEAPADFCSFCNEPAGWIAAPDGVDAGLCGQCLVTFNRIATEFGTGDMRAWEFRDLQVEQEITDAAIAAASEIVRCQQ